MRFTNDDLKRLKALLDANTGPVPSRAFFYAFIARLEAAESALDSYDRLYHAYDDESLDEYKRWLRVAGKI